MKALSLGSLLLFGLAGAQTDAASPVPSCVVDCTDSLAKQLSPAERMQTLCHGVAGQRALFQCLVNSCHAHTYGSALGHVVSACSDLGVAISPLHPVEVLYATHAKRQVVPTQPGPVLPGPSTLYHTRTLTLNHHVSMGLECRTGADGIITLSVDVPDPGATPPPTSKNVTTACTSSDAPASLVVSNTLAPAQSTACPCHGTDSSSIPSLQLMSATLLQGPTEQQTTTVPSPSSSLVITQLSAHPIGAQSENCNKTTTLANNVTVATSGAHLSPTVSSTAEGPCSNSSSVRTVLVVTASPSWSLSVADFSSRADDFSSTARVDPVTSGHETTSCSSASSSASPVQDFSSSASLAQVSASLLQVSASLRQVSANVTTAVFSGGPLRTNSATLSTLTTLTTLTSSATLSTLTTLTSLSTSGDPTTAPPTYTAPGLPEPPAYLSPLPAYSYNPVPAYGNPGVSASSSSFITQRLSTPTPSFGSAGIMGARDTMTTSGAGSTLSSPYPVSYGQGPQPSSSLSHTPLPIQTVDNALFLWLDTASIRGANRHEEEKRAGDWASSTTPDKPSGLDATSTVSEPDHVASGIHMTPSLTTSGSRSLVPNLALVCAAAALALVAMGMTGR